MNEFLFIAILILRDQKFFKVLEKLGFRTDFKFSIFLNIIFKNRFFKAKQRVYILREIPHYPSLILN
jgi:hypothetical protein